MGIQNYKKREDRIIIKKVATSLKEIRNIIYAFELLFDKNPTIRIKGNFTYQYDDYYIDYEEVYKLTSKEVYFNSSEERKQVPLYTYDGMEKYNIILES